MLSTGPLKQTGVFEHTAVFRARPLRRLPIAVASNGVEGEDARQDPLLVGRFSDLRLGRAGSGVLVASDQREVHLDCALTAEAFASVEAAIAELKERYGDASMVPAALRRSAETR